MSIKVAILKRDGVGECPAKWCQGMSGGFACSGCASIHMNDLRQMARRKPDAVLFRIPGFDQRILDQLRFLKGVLKRIPLLILTGDRSPHALLASLMAGASGYMLAPAERMDLETAIQRVLQGEVVISSPVFSCLIKSFQAANDSLADESPLSPRELQILSCLFLGYRNKEIASELGIGEGTIHTHLHRLFGKLRVRSRREALNKFLTPEWKSFSMLDNGIRPEESGLRMESVGA